MLALGARARAAETTHRPLCRACFCVMVHPLSHLCYQHTPVSGSRTRDPSLASLSPHPRVQLPQSESSESTRGSRRGPPAACASLSPSGRARPSVLPVSPSCLAPRRVRLLSSEPLCWRPTPHTHADPGPYPRPQCSPPSSQCSSDTPSLFLPEDVSPRAAFRTSFPSGLLISTKMSPPPQGHPSIIQSKITIIHFLLYHSILFLCIKYLNIRY